MSSLRLPEVVNYTSQGRTVKALVLSGREGEVSHLGKNGEPLLTLAFVKQPAPNAPHKRPTVLQAALATPEMQFEHDVVHASHEFSSDFKRDKGIQTEAQIAAHRGHGEWSEVEDGSDAGFEVLFRDNAALRNDLKDAWTNCHAAEKEEVAAKAEVQRLNKLVADLSADGDSQAEAPPSA